MSFWLGALMSLVAHDALPPRRAFLPQPQISAVTLAPDGRRVAWLAEEGARHAVWMQLPGVHKPQRLMAHTPATDLAFTRDGRWLLLGGAHQIYALAVDGQTGSGLLASLSPRSEWRVDPTQPAAITVLGPMDRRAQQWQLQRHQPGAAPELLHQDAHRISGYALAPDGDLRWLQRVEGNALTLYSYPHLRPRLRCGELERCTPLGEIDGALWMLYNGPDGDPMQLARIVRHSSDGMVTLARDPLGEADLDFIVADPTGRPRLAGYRSTAPALQALDPPDASAVTALQKAFPGSLLRPQIGTGGWLVEERHPARPSSRWYLFDPVTQTLQLLLQDHREPAPMGLAQQPYRWVASDGMRLHGFVTVPPGDPRTLPLVVLAHGGPWSHWQPAYHSMAQFIASRGAIVFQPNHRGSTGHGLRYLLAAGGDYGNGRVQADINEGVRALLTDGLGDPQRVAIVGASYGGYAALLGATFAPDLYQTAIAFVPPPDFAWTLNWVLRNAESVALDGLVPMQDWLRMLDLDVHDSAHMARLRAQSPLANLDRLRRPVLVVAGAEDERVGIAGIIEYAARARLAGKAVSLYLDPNTGHRLRDDNARETALYLIELMLHRHLGMPAPAAPDPTMADALSRHLRLAPAAN